MIGKNTIKVVIEVIDGAFMQLKDPATNFILKSKVALLYLVLVKLNCLTVFCFFVFFGGGGGGGEEGAVLNLAPKFKVK